MNLSGVLLRTASAVSRLLPGCLVTLAAVSIVAADARPLSPEDLYAVRDVSDAQLSPDGEWVIYTVTQIDRERDARVSDLWLVGWDGTRRVRLTQSTQSDWHARFSPDNRWIAFLSDRGGDDSQTQVWLMDRGGGEARQLTHLEHDVTGFAWSPDSRRIALSSWVDPNVDSERPQPIVIDRFQFKEDGTGYLTGARSQLFVIDVESGDTIRLSDGAYDESDPAWSPDGRQIAFISKRGDDPDRHADWNVYRREANADSEVVLVTSNPGSDTAEWGGVGPQWNPAGRRILYEHGGAPEDSWYGLRQVGISPVSGGDADVPTESLDRNAFAARWSPDGRAIYFLLESEFTVQLAHLRLGDGELTRLTPADRVVYSYDVGADGRAVVVMSGDTAPAEVWRLDGNTQIPLSQHNDDWLSDVDLVATEAFHYPSDGRQSIGGLSLTPPDGDAALPLILKLHGGPVGQYQHEFNFEWQLYAANGYLVAGINPRGSSGRGYDFQRAVFGAWGIADMPDVLAAVDYLVENGRADPERLGVGGWSYGGMLTNYAIASTDRFKAAISGAGISNMLLGYGTDHYVRDWETELGLPWEETDAWLRVSYPFFEAERISTPTLFVCGQEDWNVPLIASEQMFQALKRLGVPTQLVIYPGQSHSITRPSFEHDIWVRYLGWYARYLKGGSDKL